MFVRYINSCSIVGLLLFIHSLYNRADVFKADHNPVYETKVRAKRRLQKSDLRCRRVWSLRLTAAPYWASGGTVRYRIIRTGKGVVPISKAPLI